MAITVEDIKDLLADSGSDIITFTIDTTKLICEQDGDNFDSWQTLEPLFAFDQVGPTLFKFSHLKTGVDFFWGGVFLTFGSTNFDKSALIPIQAIEQVEAPNASTKDDLRQKDVVCLAKEILELDKQHGQHRLNPNVYDKQMQLLKAVIRAHEGEKK